MCYTEFNSESAEFRNIKDNGTLLSVRNQGLAARKVEGWVIMKKILFVASEAYRNVLIKNILMCGS